MLQNENIFELFFDSLKKLLYPEEWIALDLDFSKSELFTMLLVDRNGEIIMSRIADYVNVSMSTANGIVERLIKKGYLERNRSDSDRRIVVIRLTEEGKNLVRDLKSIVSEYVMLVYNELNDEERKLIFKVIGKVTQILEKKSHKNSNEISGNQLKRIDIE
jgi:DNA-binding MarR family transcriptional regulator